MPALQILGPYRIISLLGAGGMGVAYVAQRIGRSELSVVKRIHDRTDESGAEALARFAREARVAQMLVHPSIVRLEDSAIAGDASYIATQFVAGATVGALYAQLRLEGRPLPRDVALYVVARLLSALGYMHRFTLDGQPSTMIHRDISGGNVMLGFDGSVKLIDFGLSRFLESKTRITKAAPAATEEYMAPEGPVSAPTYDVYAASLLAYDLLCSGRASRLARETRQAGRGGGEVNLEALDGHVAEEIAAVVRKGLAFDPAGRWSDCQEMYEALVAAAGREPSGRTELGELVRVRFPKQLLSAQIWEVTAQAFQLGLSFEQGTGAPHATAVSPSPLVAREGGTEFVPRRRDNAELLDVAAIVDGFVGSPGIGAPGATATRPPAPRATPRGRLVLPITVAVLLVLVVALAAQRMLGGSEPGSSPEPPPRLVVATSASPTASPSAPPSTEASAGPTPTSVTPEPRPPTPKPTRAPSTDSGARDLPSLAALGSRLERSLATPISTDPAFERFVSEAERAAARLPPAAATEANRHIRLLLDDPTPARVRDVVRTLEAE